MGVIVGWRRDEMHTKYALHNTISNNLPRLSNSGGGGGNVAGDRTRSSEASEGVISRGVVCLKQKASTH